MFKIIFFKIIIIFFFVTLGYSDVLILDNSFQMKPLGYNLEYLEDKNNLYKFEDIRNDALKGLWSSSKTESLGFGFTNSVYWVRFTLKNVTDNDIEFYIEQDYPLIDDLKLYVPEINRYKIIEVGDQRPYNERPYDNRNFVFPLILKKHQESTYYMQYKTESSMNIVLTAFKPETFRKMTSHEYFFLMIFYGILLIMIAYNLIIYFFIKQIEYLFYVLFLLHFLIFLMTLNGTAFQFLWPDCPGWVNSSNPILLYLLIFFVGLFCVELVGLRSMRKGIPYKERMFKFVVLIYSIGVPSFILSIFLPYIYAMAISALFAGFVLGIMALFGVILIIKERNRQAMFALLAGAAFLLGGMAFVFKTFGVFTTNFLTEWSLYIGSIIMVTIFSIALADRINVMRMEIEKTESKYRNLVESSNDIIFSLDKNLNFLSINKAMYKNLGFKEKDVLGKNFLDFIHDKWIDKPQIDRDLVIQYIDELKKSKISVNFRTNFRTWYSHEPKELSVKLEYSEDEDAKEKILGKASIFVDDIILKYLESEKHSYKTDNYLKNAELLSHRLTRNLSKFLNPTDISDIRLSLREILINAIEHGNLNIKFEEKTKAILDGNYLNFIKDRQDDPRYKGRKVSINYILLEDRVIYSITDEGNGFDYQNVIANLSDKANKELISHGRGLMLAQYAFDELKFNEKGNQIFLVRKFAPSQKLK